MGTLAKTTLAVSSQILAPWGLWRGERKWSGQIDLRTKIDAILKVAVGLPGDTTFTTGVNVIVRRFLYNTGVVPNYADNYFADVTRLTAGYRLVKTTGGAGIAAGVTSINWDTSTGTAPVAGDVLIFPGCGFAAVPTAADGGANDGAALVVNHGAEAGIIRVIGTTGSGGTALQIDRPTVWDHHEAELIAVGSSWEIPLEGGYLYDLLIDVSTEAAGKAVVAFADLQSIDTYTSA